MGFSKELTKRIEDSRFGKNIPGVVEALTGIADALEGVDGAIGNAMFELYSPSDLKTSKYVPVIILAVVESESLLNGQKVDVDLVDCEE